MVSNFNLFSCFPRLGICDRDGSQSYGLWIPQLLAFYTKPIRLRHHSDYRSAPCLTFQQDTYLLHAYDSYKLYTAELAIYSSMGLCLMLLIADFTQWLRRLRPSFRRLNSPSLAMKNGKFSTPSWFGLLSLCYLLKLLGLFRLRPSHICLYTTL